MTFCPYAKAAYIQGLVARGENIHNIGAIHMSESKIGENPARQVLECGKENCGMYVSCTNGKS
ncbi:hypothetical protein [Desulfurispira natronophila]|uniref:Uncharacterized protein n=1 Tax=Desulfurispira natronophila TaxID=682562 RepID=A0A7W8DGH2_9BACT|nr:hypothetical protein [Desulfurispira natronophila]MBB5021496.1 hypothetical protein [Desulfurispira natronophila]